MKLTDIRPVIESSGQMEEQFFSIKDQGMIFDILRNKMYSNPILAICREITCNARDAHREVGKPDVPIQITLPNTLDWNYRVKDFGPGISPDRMSNIFIQYTASTKRDSNVQTGGFGLGAKTPFSYSDTFTIITIYSGIKYHYACFIDETKVGKLALLSQEETKEANSTEITIPVEPKDCRLFIEWTEHACRHWSVKPNIKGGTIPWQTPNITLEGKGWAISHTGNQYDRQAKMIIDGIEYPLPLDTLRTYANTQLLDSCSGHVLMYFGVGELSLSASREQVYLDKNTKDKVKKRLEDMQADVKKILNDKIEAFPNLWQANLYYRKQLSHAFHNFHFLGKLQWKGIELSNGWIPVDCPSFHFTRGAYSRKHGHDPTKLSRSRMTSIHFDENTSLFINDLPIREPTPTHVKKAFEDDPKLHGIQVICPTDTITEKLMNKTIHLDQMGIRRLSEITKTSGRGYTAPASRLLVFKFSPGGNHFRQVSYSTIDEDTNHKVLCLLTKDTYTPANRVVYFERNRLISLASMRSITDRTDKISFYGVDAELPADRIQEEFGDFETIEKYVEDNVLNNKDINYVEIKFAAQHSYHISDELLKNSEKFKELISDPESPFLKRLATHQKVKDINDGDNGLLVVYEALKGKVSKKDEDDFLKNHPELNLERINKEFIKIILC